MALDSCPSCNQTTSDSDGVCGNCGYDLGSTPVAPIKKISGKFALIGVVLIAAGVIGTAIGTWWGPPTILPGLAFYLMAKFF
jgi:hypothetical protein